MLLAAALLLRAVPAACAEEDMPRTSARSAVLLDRCGRTLYEQQADEPLPIASTTKLMTALLVLERCDPDEEMEIPAECCGVEGSSMYLVPGQRCTVRELLLGLLLASANDAALALAVHTAGDVESFAALMNARAQSLGMEHSAFANPHGLDAEGHYATARDLARLMLRCMRQPGFAELCAQPSAVIGEQTICNHNKLLARCPGCLAGKTGYTASAGRCLVSCTEREGTLFVCVTLSDPDDWNDHIRLYDWAFSHYGEREAVPEDLRYEIPVLSGALRAVHAVPAHGCRLLLPRGEEPVLTAELPRFVFAPVPRGGEAGRLLIRSGEETLAEIPLLFAEAVEETQDELLSRILKGLLS